MAEGNEYEARETHARIHKEISLLKALCGTWNRLPRGALESPSLQVFKKPVDLELSSVVVDFRLEVGLDDLTGLLQPEQFYDSVLCLGLLQLSSSAWMEGRAARVLLSSSRTELA